jgi:mannose-6-phosphate isomerase-like protein (cupin superfamily)
MLAARMPSMYVEPGGGHRRRTPWGEVVAGKVTGGHTGGAYSLEELSTAAGWSRLSYVHHEVDECFYVLEGNFTIVLDDRDKSLHLDPGAVLFVPRGVARSFECTSNRGRLLLLQTPARPLDPAAPLAGVERVDNQPNSRPFSAP